MAIFKVAAHIINKREDGYISYDTETKHVESHVYDDAVDQQVVAYLTTEQVMHRYTSLAQFDKVSAVPASSLENFKLALCTIWSKLGVHIDWSRPVD